MENPLRAVLAEPFPPLVNGRFALTDAPGLGVAPNLLEAKSFLVHRSEHRK
jgi:D-galactarolactone cycloisomerase